MNNTVKMCLNLIQTVKSSGPSYTLLATVQFTCVHITDTMYLMKRASTSTESSVLRASAINNPSLVIGGDFNCPGLEDKSIKAGAAYTGLNHRFS